MITDVPGVLAGHCTGDGTGVTVILCPEGTIGSGEVRGGAPATREIALLDPTKTVERVDAVVLAGGSAFGLGAADGVVEWLAEQGRGAPTTGGVVPIVPTACIYDLVPLADSAGTGGDWRRPGPSPEDARAALEAAVRGDPITGGRVGAGTGATVGKWRGAEHAVPGGVGQASTPVALGDVQVTVAALAVVNGVGDVIDEAGQVLAGSTAPPDAESFPEHKVLLADEANTTLVVVATDARIPKLECHLVAQSVHHGIAHALRPSHTRFDGDLVIALSTGAAPPDGTELGPTAIDRLRHAATGVVAEAVRNAVRQT